MSVGVIEAGGSSFVAWIILSVHDRFRLWMLDILLLMPDLVAISGFSITVYI